MAVISTERLDLIPMGPDFLRASLSGDPAAASVAIGATLPPDWPSIPEILAMRLEQLEAVPALEPWLLRAMVLRETRTMVGHIGFHTAPGPEYLEPWSPGAVEFGFSVLEEHRRRGYAREAAQGMMRWAVDEHGVRAFVLTISPGNHPSQALASGLGFHRIGEHVDEVDGIEEILELRMGS
ncbi:GNAT family N-acetyltransferase [Luteolibacter ambystomatis]|uniref:GNAT family N-acetyltransferase n=1 Tax=Luteolibacter ambystomatis TaxID=2824561 RepID=A0A975J2D6_9BACT|nr:GNAT family N-acetyltransferase [Luteolibacter ambystomatis]QUE52756.1 GNAT family N-acetyltransferase [Luteolibacter ambystomatis]